MRITKFDIVKFLDSEEAMAEYLAAVLEEKDHDLFLIALNDVAKAKGIAGLAEATGLNRVSLYKTLSPGAKPRFDTIMKITEALGVPLTCHRPAVSVEQVDQEV